MSLSAITPQSSGSGIFLVLKFVQGSEQKDFVMERTPFTVGRKVDKDLVIADPRVSRDHAQILKEGQEFFLVDLGSKHGTFVNGERVQRQKLERGDRLELGRAIPLICCCSIPARKSPTQRGNFSARSR